VNKITQTSYELVVTVESPPPDFHNTRPAPIVRVELREFDPERLIERERAVAAKAAREAATRAQYERDKAAAEAQETERLARVHGEVMTLIENGNRAIEANSTTVWGHSREQFDHVSAIARIVRAATSKAEQNGLDLPELADLRRAAGPVLSSMGLRL
jgi:hypothetical protein